MIWYCASLRNFSWLHLFNTPHPSRRENCWTFSFVVCHRERHYSLSFSWIRNTSCSSKLAVIGSHSCVFKHVGQGSACQDSLWQPSIDAQDAFWGGGESHPCTAEAWRLFSWFIIDVGGEPQVKRHLSERYPTSSNISLPMSFIPKTPIALCFFLPLV